MAAELSTRHDPRRRRDDGPRFPLLSVAASADGIAEDETGQILCFDERVVIGRGGAEGGPAEAPSELGWGLRDGLVSKRHCSITRVHGSYELADLGSRNGTRLDGVKLGSSPVELRDGGVLFVGGQILVFRRVSQGELDALAEERAAPFAPSRTLSPGVALVCWRLRRLARVDREILLVGETGVGKEIFAKAVHRASGRAGAFVPINCAALPGELIESELFGFERGAHAQATQGKPGLLEQAEGGTLFLDEIGEMPQELQVKLLRFLQDREVTPLGGTRPRRLDVRVVAATSRPIPAAASADETSSLRPDLLMRFGPEPILLPPLRDRIEDLGLLARAIGGGAPLRFEPIALQALSLYSWPGNVRELGKVLEDARLFSGAEAVGLDALPAGIAQLDSSSDDLPDDAPTRPAPTAAELKSALRQSRGVMRHAARLLGRQPSLVYRWCHRHGIDPTVFR